MRSDANQTLTPKIRFAEFRKEIGWQTVLLGDACDVLNNRRKPITSNNRKPGPYPYYGASGIVDFVADYIFDERLVLIGEDGAKWGSFENTAFIAEGKYWVNNHAHVLKPRLVIDSLVVAYLVMLDIGPFVTGAAPPKLTLGKLKSIPITFPASRQEQQKIASCLTSLDDLVAAQGRKVEALKAHKKSLMQQLFPREGETVPPIRFPEFRDRPNWAVDPLGELFDTMTGGTPERSVKDYWDGNIPWVTTSLVDFNVIHGCGEFITESGLEQSSAKLFPKNTVLVALYGQGKTRGKVAMLGIEAATNQACAAILPSKDIDPAFTFLSLCGRYDEMRKLSNSGGQENLSQGLLRALPIRYPKEADEQRRVVDCLFSLDSQIAAESRKLAALQAHKNGLMQQLFPSPEGD